MSATSYYVHLAATTEHYVECANRSVLGYREELVPKIIDDLNVSGVEGCLVDLGSGPGYIAGEIALRTSLVRIDCVERQPEMIAAAADYFAKLPESASSKLFHVPSDVMKYTPDGPVNAVLASLLLHNLSLDDKKSLLSKVAEWLGEGDVFYWFDLVSYADPEYERRQYEIRKVIAIHLGEDPNFAESTLKKELNDDNRQTEGEMMNLVSQAGFSNVQAIWHGPTLVLLKCIK